MLALHYTMNVIVRPLAGNIDLMMTALLLVKPKYRFVRDSPFVLTNRITNLQVIFLGRYNVIQ